MNTNYFERTSQSPLTINLEVLGPLLEISQHLLFGTAEEQVDEFATAFWTNYFSNY